jgi:hypothetical protein
MTGALRPAAAVTGFGGACALSVAPLLSSDDPFDAALRVTVWVAVVVAASSGAGKPAALFGFVATAVEISGLLAAPDGPDTVWPVILAVPVTAALTVARNGPGPGRVIARRVRPATGDERSRTEAA